ncbi:hypothetical protein GY45DRAFT_1003892 [Cubamyces sp. BRFM 1775]|nr:hypothetical protein GY45DRAFT_1003892 [Cubamyces sp. BRFM 1775]
MRARRRASRTPFMGGGISSESYVPPSPSLLPDSPQPGVTSPNFVAPSARAPTLPDMSYVVGGSGSLGLSAGRGALFPSVISASSASNRGSGSSSSGMVISPMPSEDPEAGFAAAAAGRGPYMRETMVSSAGESVVVPGAGAAHSSLSADAFLDPFADPVRAMPAPEPVVTPAEAEGEAERAVDPFADPMRLAPGQERLSVLTMSDVEPGEAM